MWLKMTMITLLVIGNSDAAYPVLHYLKSDGTKASRLKVRTYEA